MTSSQSIEEDVAVRFGGRNSGQWCVTDVYARRPDSTLFGAVSGSRAYRFRPSVDAAGKAYRQAFPSQTFFHPWLASAEMASYQLSVGP